MELEKTIKKLQKDGASDKYILDFIDFFQRLMIRIIGND